MVALKSVASAYMDARPNKSFHRKHSVSFAAKSEPYRSTVRVTDRKDDPTDVVAGLIILRRGTGRPVFKVILIWLREVLLARPPGTEVNLMLLTRMLARVNFDLVREVFLVILLVFSAVAGDISAANVLAVSKRLIFLLRCQTHLPIPVNVRADPKRLILLFRCQSYLTIAVPPRWIVVLGVD
ncbi:hypothetical protein PoB_002956100 [Plakobranchus ocellatus]|uniref:Uncharacterized protein n=1 Tax=Plakobranchus ocellatus TaxID=259542 RepID=A0AAV3ZVR4_9GAST|nr:hypothetical protein PoB_002956100 [Plakobranchus ocellatus]